MKTASIFGLTLSLFLIGCLPAPDNGNDDDDKDGVFSISGSVNEQSASLSLTLSLNNTASETLAIASDATEFTFTTLAAMNDVYSVVVQTQPVDQICRVGQGTGTVVTDVSNVVISCVDQSDVCAAYDPLLETEKYDGCHAWLNAHNAVRDQLNAGNLPNSPQPSIAVPTLLWDEDLATVAESYASQCQSFAHNSNRTTDYAALGGSDTVGENIAVATGLSYTESEFTGLWADEEDYYIYEPFDGTGTGGEPVGHYTQIIWSSTTRVGCAIANCTGQPIGWDQFAVCNYAPTGNYTNQYPYTN